MEWVRSTRFSSPRDLKDAGLEADQQPAPVDSPQQPGPRPRPGVRLHPLSRHSGFLIGQIAGVPLSSAAKIGFPAAGLLIKSFDCRCLDHDVGTIPRAGSTGRTGCSTARWSAASRHAGQGDDGLNGALTEGLRAKNNGPAVICSAPATISDAEAEPPLMNHAARPPVISQLRHSPGQIVQLAAAVETISPCSRKASETVMASSSKPPGLFLRSRQSL